jgi:hypothetical protein
MQDKIIEGFQLSLQQEYLWPLQRSWAQCAIMLEGVLNKESLKNALQQLVSDHEILRTTFHRPQGLGTPFQVINEESALLWSISESEDLEQAFAAQAREPFDYENGPLLRASLLALSMDRHVLLLTLPVLLADGQTLSNLCEELGRAYAGDTSSSDDAMQYVDFTTWQHELLESEEAEEAAAFWRQVQSSLPLPIQKLPLRLQAETVLGRADAGPTFYIGEVARIEAVASTYEVSASDWLYACWQVLMWRLTGEATLVTGNVLDGRSHEELYKSLGPFARTLPIRSHFESDFSFSDVLKQVKQATSEAARWQNYFAPRPGASMPVVFACETLAEKFVAGGVVFSTLKQEVCTGDFTLKLVCQRAGENFEARFHYDAELLAVEDVARLGEEFAQLVASTLNDPKAKIDQIEILGTTERQRLLHDLNDTAVSFPGERCFHELFEEQAAHTPEAVAVVFEDQQLTFAQLNTAARHGSWTRLPGCDVVGAFVGDVGGDAGHDESGRCLCAARPQTAKESSLFDARRSGATRGPDAATPDRAAIRDHRASAVSRRRELGD